MSQMMLWALIGFVAGGYLLGSLPWAWVIGRAHGLDIRKHGSGNVGATNVSRVLGKRWGLLCFALDFVKGLLPVMAARLLLAGHELPGTEHDLLLIATVLAPVAGHNWSVFLGFRGGKGVAVSAGALAALTPWAVLAALLVWVAVFETSRYVSLASIVAAPSLPLAAWLLDFTGLAPHSPRILILLILLAVAVVVRHHSNLRRLLAGTESRFERKGETSNNATPANPDNQGTTS